MECTLHRHLVTENELDELYANSVVCFARKRCRAGIYPLNTLLCFRYTDLDIAESSAGRGTILTAIREGSYAGVGSGSVGLV